MSKTTPQFDFEKALEELKAVRILSGKNGILTPLIKQLTEAALAAELEQHILSGDEQNRKNGSMPKTVKSASGSFQLDTPRDRNGTFEPQLVKMHQTHLTDEIERKILSLFALGSSYQDISGHIAELYGIEVSTATLSAVTDKLIPALREWQQLPLNSHYPFV
jgi:putative transposase